MERTTLLATSAASLSFVINVAVDFFVSPIRGVTSGCPVTSVKRASSTVPLMLVAAIAAEVALVEVTLERNHLNMRVT